MLYRKNILHILLILILLAKFVCVWSQEITYKSGGCTLTYKKIDEYSVEVAKQSPTLNKEKIFIPTEINYNDTTFYVIGIGDNAFSGNTKIEKVTFSAECDIKYIGEGAFAGCQNLTEIELPSTITEIKPYTFAWCGLKRIEIHNFITKIGERAFTNCKQLTKIEMSENIEEIGNFAFAWCNELTSFTIPEKTKKLGYEILQANRDLDTLYYNAINCEDAGAYYDERVDRTIGAFEGNKGLSEIVFGYKVEYIPEYLLYNCRSIDSIYFPRSIKKIGRFALHNTEWFYGAKSDLIYANNIAYFYRGKDRDIDRAMFKEGTTAIAAHCFSGSEIETVVLPSTIQLIGISAFENCKNLKKITFSTDLESIDDFAFWGCDNLESVTFAEGLIEIGRYSFANCTGLHTAKLPQSVNRMGVATFYNCTNLENVKIPQNTTIVPAGCFSNCESLRSIEIHNDVEEINEYAFAGCLLLDSIKIPWVCTKIGTRAFSNCMDLESVNFLAKSAKIEPLAFYKCYNIKYISLLGVEEIGYRAFADCRDLKNVIFGENLTTIDNRAFENCYSLSSLSFPQKMSRIGKSAFENCKNLISIDANNATLEIGNRAFAKCKLLSNVDLGYNVSSIGQYAFSYCEQMESFSIPSSIDSIAKGCFYKCINLRTIDLPDNVKHISSNAFEKCHNITNITIPNSVISIGERAFAECYALNNLTLSNQLEDIDEYAFFQCYELETINIPTTLEKIGHLAFGECNNLKNIYFNAENCRAGKPIFSYTSSKANLHIGNIVMLIDDRIFENLNIEQVTIPNSVTKIGKWAFANSTPLAQINLKTKGAIEIDNSAFENTTWYNNQTDQIIYISNVAYKYVGPENPSKIVLKDGTTDIASNFMKDNHKLEEVTLPGSLLSIGCSAFENCTNLKKIYFPTNIRLISRRAFENCSNLESVELSSTISHIDDYAFENCSNITEIKIDDAFCEIGVAAFRNCSALKHAHIGNNVVAIGDMAFSFCTNLKSVNDKKGIVLPPNLKTINYATFYCCESLYGKITIPYNVTTIRDLAFGGCRSIHSVELSTKTDSISFSAFDKAYNFTRYIRNQNNNFNVYNGMLYSNNMATLYHCPEGYRNTCVIHAETRKINTKAFDNCSNIKNIILNVERIEDYAFNGCTNLRHITIGAKTYHIGQEIFNGCQSLTHIDVKKNNNHYKSVDGVLYTADMTTLLYCPKAKTGKFKIPKKVKHIADFAFYNCNQIEVIVHKNIETIGKEAFTGCKFETK